MHGLPDLDLSYCDPTQRDDQHRDKSCHCRALSDDDDDGNDDDKYNRPIFSRQSSQVRLSRCVSK